MFHPTAALSLFSPPPSKPAAHHHHHHQPDAQPLIHQQQPSLEFPIQGEWVISRVFQKNGTGGSTTTSGGKKRHSGGITTTPEVSSPSSVSLPPLLEPSTDLESCSYTSINEHMPCFSMTAPPPPPFNHNSLFELPPPPLMPPSLNSLTHEMPSSLSSRFSRHIGSVAAFPSLRSLQENLQLPFLFSAVAPPGFHGGGGDYQMGCYGSHLNQWSVGEDQKMGSTELDCMWTN